MKKLIRLTVINAGGEFTAGVIDDQEIKDKLRKKIDEGSVNTFMEFDDETYFEASNYTNILHQYGPNVPGSVVMTEESFDVDTEDDYDRNYEEISSDDIDDTDVKRFTSSNPYPEGGTSGYAQDDLIFYSQKIEKRIHYPVVIEINDEEEFDLGNVYIGSMNMDETISDDEIIEDILYIPKDKAIEYTKEYLADNYDNDCYLSEYIDEIYSESPELKEKIRSKHLLHPGDIEGKGEWENDYVKVTTLDGEVLFEDGIY